MLLYDCDTAPSPRRVRIFLAEKGIAIPVKQVDLRNGEQFTGIFRRLCPELTVPMLELDDGTRLFDIVGICRYFEEINPIPDLFGHDPITRAKIDGLLRWCDREGFYSVMDAFRNSTPGLVDRALPGPINYPQLPALADRSRIRINSFFERLDALLSTTRFIAGTAFSIADITALVSIDFAGWIKIVPDQQFEHLNRWLEMVRARPSASA